MNDTQLDQFETEEPLQDDSDCFEESEIIEEGARRTGNTNWCLCELYVLLAPSDVRAFDCLLPTFESGSVSE